MMMAHDQAGPPPAMVSDATRDALRGSLDAYLSSGGSTDAVRHALHQFAAEGRERQIHAEHLLILLKELWYSLPATQRSRTADEQNRLLQRVVTICIQAYYQDS